MSKTDKFIKELPGYIHEYQMMTNELLISALEKADSQKEYTVDDFPEIRSLNLVSLNLCTISNLSDFFQLRKLDLQNNSIERLTGLDQLVNLETLNVSFNKLSSLEGVEKLIHLTDLVLNKNKISNVTPLYAML